MWRREPRINLKFGPVQLEGLSSYLRTWEKLQKKHIWRKIYEFYFGHAKFVMPITSRWNYWIHSWIYESGIQCGSGEIQVTYVTFNFLVTTFLKAKRNSIYFSSIFVTKISPNIIISKCNKKKLTGSFVFFF